MLLIVNALPTSMWTGAGLRRFLSELNSSGRYETLMIQSTLKECTDTIRAVYAECTGDPSFEKTQLVMNFSSSQPCSAIVDAGHFPNCALIHVDA